MKSSFESALSAVLRYEGGYSNHPDDPGGPTMKGIIQRVYDAYRRSKGQTTRSVKLLDDGELRDIYRTQYWDAVRADELPAGLDLLVFDGAVNSGPAQSAKWFQRALGVKDDGVIGDVTLQAARDCADKAGLIDKVCDRRLSMLRSLKTWPTFGKGWSARVADLRRLTKVLLAGAPRDTIPPVVSVGAAILPEESAKADPADRSAASVLKSPEGIAAATGAVASIASAATDPGPLQWALSAGILIGLGILVVFLVKRARAA